MDSIDPEVLTEPDVPGEGEPGDSPEPQVMSDPVDSDVPDLVSDPVPTTLFDRLRDDHELDLSTKYESEDELVKGLANAVRAIGRRDELSELGRQYQQHAPEFNEYLQSKQEPIPEVVPEDDVWWKAPEWDDSWNKYIKRDEHGDQFMDESTPLLVRQKIEERQQHLARWTHSLTTDPDKALAPALDRVRRQAVTEAQDWFMSQQSEQQTRYQADQIVNQNMEWMFGVNSSGQILRDAGGNTVLTPMGRSYVENVYQLAEGGMSDPARLDHVAKQLAQSQMSSPRGKVALNTPVIPSESRPALSGDDSDRRKVSGLKGMTLREKLMATATDADEPEYAR